MTGVALKRGALAVGRWLGKQGPAATPAPPKIPQIPAAPKAPAPAGPPAAGAAPAPAAQVLTPEQKKMVMGVLITRADGAKANAEHGIATLGAGSDFPQAFRWVGEYRAALSVLVEQGKKLAVGFDWAGAEKALARGDDVLRRAADEWNDGQDVARATPALRDAMNLYVKADAVIRSALKSAGVL